MSFCFDAIVSAVARGEVVFFVTVESAVEREAGVASADMRALQWRLRPRNGDDGADPSARPRQHTPSRAVLGLGKGGGGCRVGRPRPSGPDRLPGRVHAPVAVWVLVEWSELGTLLPELGHTRANLGVLVVTKLKENVPGLVASLVIAAVFAGVAYWAASGIAAFAQDQAEYGIRRSRHSGRLFGMMGLIAIGSGLVSLVFLFVSGWIFVDCFRAKPPEEYDSDLRDPLAPPPRRKRR